MEKEKFANFRGMNKIEVAEIDVNEGAGTLDDPGYRETYYVRLDTGQVIGHSSSFSMRKFARRD